MERVAKTNDWISNKLREIEFWNFWKRLKFLFTGKI
jgi:hypothetical protein